MEKNALEWSAVFAAAAAAAAATGILFQERTQHCHAGDPKK
jgi:hypothetical protein